jgi:histidinol dehydrogenase
MQNYNNPSRSQWESILKRPTATFDDVESVVVEVFNAVKASGDQALKEYTKKFDRTEIDDLEVSSQELTTAENTLSKDLKQAIDLAYDNIYKFHKAQQTSRVEVETTSGVDCWQEKRPIQKVGFYIPGGSAPLFSTVLMLAIPAQIAGCSQVVLCTPPTKEGTVHPAVLYAAKRCGIQNIYKVGGIQAIAAMTYGTESITKVYKIFGPGNQFVTLAKQYATTLGVAIDMPAGPSELLVVGDSSANPAFVASDLLSQAEHGPDSQVILVSTDKKLIDEVSVELEKQLEELPRKEIAKKAIANSKMIYFDSKQDAADCIDEYGPEHYIICCEEEQFYIDAIHNAGSVFIGNYTPESAGDYASGTNHTLPTNGYTKQYSGVNLDSFLKQMTFQKISEKGIQAIGPAIELMAEEEGLQAHKNAVTLRLNELKANKE